MGDDLWSSLMALPPQQGDHGMYESLIQGRPYSGFRRSENIDDRRDRPDMTPEWKNVPGSISALATSVGNYLWGAPSIPAAPVSPLGLALGMNDISLEKKISSRSPLDRAIDEVVDTISMFRKPGEKLGSDVPYTQRSFSKGYF